MVHRDGRYAMGTVLEVLLVEDGLAEARATASAIFGLVESLEAELSTWRPRSAVSRLNAAAGEGPVRVPPFVARALREAVRASALTRGAFDVTVGPLVDLWDRAEQAGRLPEPAALEAARARVGAQRLRFLDDGRVALAPGSRVDLGGLAKGFALDRVEALLRERGVRAALVSFGQSSVLALGRPPDAPGFRVLLRGAGDAPAGVVTFPERGHLSVSASFGQSREIAGRRFGHVIDPRTGRPLERPALAAVLAPSGTLAEALSKALLVLPAEKAILLLEALPEVEGLHVDADGALRETSGFRAATAFAPLAAGAAAPGAAPAEPAPAPDPP
ncbi:MAG: FAD:protein FMN transferase [Myxococcota bacterium]|nr:FAD:protein FMN transferase [Myxococcota bacterium]